MGRKPKKYTKLGAKVASLAKNQVEIARVLGLTQQSISVKLQGKIAILISDLEKLSEHYDVPMMYFFEDVIENAEMAREARKVLKLAFPSTEEEEKEVVTQV
jgi:transcriptional regulator with XRE-family HTH domain